MGKLAPRLRAVGLSGLVVSTLVAWTIGIAGPASAHPPFLLERIGFSDRYETSAWIADRFGERDEVILANGEAGNYADALVATYLAGTRNAPILLTRLDRTPAHVAEELDDYGIPAITIVGGSGVVSVAQEERLRSAGYRVTRVAGADRFATSAEVIDAAGRVESGLGIIATGTDFPDALASGPLAWARGLPVGLASQDDIADRIVASLAEAGVSEVLVVGGESVVGPEVVSELSAAGISVRERFSGANRSETSALLADYAIKHLGFTDAAVNVASGYEAGTGADALSGSALTGQENRTLLITQDFDKPGDAVIEFLQRRAGTLDEGYAFGGYGALSGPSRNMMANAGVSVPLITVSPQEASSRTLAADGSAVGGDVPDDNRTYTASGLADGTEYRIFLVDTATVDVETWGSVTTVWFHSEADPASSTGYSVDPGADLAEIVSVNGAPPVDSDDPTAEGADSSTALPVDGSITFTVDGERAGTITPVIVVEGSQGSSYAEGGTSPRLELYASISGQSARPMESFGFGGATTFTAPE